MRLPAKLKIAILLYNQDMPVGEICKVISASPSSVYNRLKGAEKMLRERLKRRYFDEE
jgi:DNA-directed RNA polymerase specialized sigma24 family protein